MIWSWLLGRLAAIGAVIVAIGGFFLYAKRQGTKDAQAEQVKQALTDAKDANEIDAKVHNLSDADLDKRLSEFTRPK